MPRKCVLFVHGIGPQEPGYSQRLLEILWANNLPDDVHHYELFFYDIFDTMNAKTDIDGLVDRFRLGDLVGTIIGDTGFAAAVAETTRKWLRDTISHVLYFAAFDDPRRAILHKFRTKLTEIIREAANADCSPFDINLTIVGHSLGTAVAYLGMHDILSHPALGLQNGVRARDFFTLASPLELIRDVGARVNRDLPNITADICKPGRDDAMTGARCENIGTWRAYHHLYDPVGSLIPLKDSLFTGEDDAQLGFGAAEDEHVHDFPNYVAHARDDITERIGAA